MSQLEDQLPEETKEAVEDAKLESKREKTEYGSLIEGDE